MKKINHFRSAKVKAECEKDAKGENGQDPLCVPGLDQLAGIVATLLDEEVLLNFFDVTLVSTVTNTLKRLIDAKDFLNDPNAKPFDCSGTCMPESLRYKDWPTKSDTAKDDYKYDPEALRHKCFQIHEQPECELNDKREASEKCIWREAFPVDPKDSAKKFAFHQKELCNAATKTECIFRYMFTDDGSHPCEWTNIGGGDGEPDHWACSMSENKCTTEAVECTKDANNKKTVANIDGSGCWQGWGKDSSENCFKKVTDTKDGDTYRKCAYDYEQSGCRTHPKLICITKRPPKVG